MKSKNIFYLSLIAVLIIVGLVSFYIIFPPQSQIRSRVFGGTVDLKIPSDCKKIVSLSFSYGKDETKKYLTYINTKNELVTKEYRDYGILEGKIRWKGFKTNMLQNTNTYTDKQTISK